METPYQKIITFLQGKHVTYEALEHEPVFTSEQAAVVRGTKLHQGAKALLFKAKNDFVLVVMPADKKGDSKKIKEVLGVKDLRFATPGEVKDLMDCEIGACYPFGGIIGIRTLVDQGLADNEFIAFNAGDHTKSLKIAYKDYIQATEPELVDVTKSE